MNKYVEFSESELVALTAELLSAQDKIRHIMQHLQYRAENPIPVSKKIDTADRLLKEGLINTPEDYFKIIQGTNE